MNWLLLHQSSDPERLTERAGTTRRQNFTYSYSENMNGSVLGETSRYVERPLLDPNEVRRLRVGEAIIISEGRYAEVAIASAPMIPSEKIAQIRTWMNEKEEEKLSVSTDPELFESSLEQKLL